jgi:hypothetical protein
MVLEGMYLVTNDFNLLSKIFQEWSAELLAVSSVNCGKYDVSSALKLSKSAFVMSSIKMKTNMKISTA